MDINNGEILSMLSMPDFDLNKREKLLTKIISIEPQRQFMSLAQYLKHLLLPQV